MNYVIQVLIGFAFGIVVAALFVKQLFQVWGCW